MQTTIKHMQTVSLRYADCPAILKSSCNISGLAQTQWLERFNVCLTFHCRHTEGVSKVKWNSETVNSCARGKALDGSGIEELILEEEITATE